MYTKEKVGNEKFICTEVRNICRCVLSRYEFIGFAYQPAILSAGQNSFLSNRLPAKVGENHAFLLKRFM